jgi:hypothetical protein
MGWWLGRRAKLVACRAPVFKTNIRERGNDRELICEIELLQSKRQLSKCRKLEIWGRWQARPHYQIQSRCQSGTYLRSSNKSKYIFSRSTDRPKFRSPFEQCSYACAEILSTNLQIKVGAHTDFHFCNNKRHGGYAFGTSRPLLEPLRRCIDRH